MTDLRKLRPSLARNLALSRFLHSFLVKIRARLSPRKALSALSSEVRLRWSRALCSDLESQVAQGCPLSLAMRGEGDLFPAGVIFFVEQGERRGDLVVGLEEAIQFLEGNINAEVVFHRAVVRPIHVLSYFFVALYVSVVAMAFLAESFLTKGHSTDARSSIELLTLSVSGMFRRFFPFVGGFGVIVFAALHLAPRHHGVRARMERFALRLPFLSGLLRSQARARFAHTTALCQGKSVSWSEIMEIAASSVPFSLIGRSFARTAEKLRSGKPWDEVLVEDGFLRKRDAMDALAAQKRSDPGKFWMDQSAAYESGAIRGFHTWRVVADMVSVLLISLLVGAVALTLYVPLFVLR